MGDAKKRLDEADDALAELASEVDVERAVAGARGARLADLDEVDHALEALSEGVTPGRPDISTQATGEFELLVDEEVLEELDLDELEEIVEDGPPSFPPPSEAASNPVPPPERKRKTSFLGRLFTRSSRPPEQDQK